MRLANGREVSSLEIQAEYLERALRYAANHELNLQEKQALQMWEHVMVGLEDDPMTLGRELDWVIKYQLVEAYRERHNLAPDDARLALLDLQYHDIDRSRSVFYKLQRRGLVERMVDDYAIAEAVDLAPKPPGQGCAVSSFGGPRSASATTRSIGCTSSSTIRPNARCCARTRSWLTTSGSSISSTACSTGRTGT